MPTPMSPGYIASPPGSPLPGSTEIGLLRPVHRALSELRRGTPVVIEGDTPLLVQAAEGASAAGLAELRDAAAGPPVLVLAGGRAGALVPEAGELADGAAIALALPDGGVADRVRRLADPTAEQLLGEPPVRVALPALAHAGLALAKLARLLPAVVAAPLAPGPGADGLLRVAASAVLGYPAAAASRLERVAEAVVPLEDAAQARLVAFRAPDAGVEHLALLIGRPEEREAPLVRLHSECFTGDFLDSLRCDCGAQLRQAIRRMAAEGAGVLLYLAQEGRGIGLVNKLRAYALQDRGLDTLDANRALGWGADERSFLVAATMLGELGLGRVRLLTNNPDKVAALAACGVEVAARLSHAIAANGVDDAYLATKARRFGHLLG